MLLLFHLHHFDEVILFRIVQPLRCLIFNRWCLPGNLAWVRKPYIHGILGLVLFPHVGLVYIEDIYVLRFVKLYVRNFQKLDLMLLPLFWHSLLDPPFSIIGVRVLLLVARTRLTSRLFGFSVGCLWGLCHLLLTNLLDRTSLSSLRTRQVVGLRGWNRLAWLLTLHCLVNKKLIFLFRALSQLGTCETLEILTNDNWLSFVISYWVKVHGRQIVLPVELCQDVVVGSKRLSRVF